MQILLFYEVTLFEYNVSTILSPIVELVHHLSLIINADLSLYNVHCKGKKANDLIGCMPLLLLEDRLIMSCICLVNLWIKLWIPWHRTMKR